MIITNQYGLPEPIVEAVRNDPYSDGGADISVTRLIAPPQIVALRHRYDGQLKEDVSDRLWATFGQLMHLLLERVNKNPRYITEKRMKAVVHIGDGVVSMPEEGKAGIILSGQLDLFDKETSTLMDYKFVGEYAFKLAKKEGKKEWEEQLNVLRWLLFKTEGILAEKLAIVGLVRDYNSRSESPGGLVEIPVWDINYTDQYVMQRLQMHTEAKLATDENLSPCTDEERWFNAKTGKYNRCER